MILSSYTISVTNIHETYSCVCGMTVTTHDNSDWVIWGCQQQKRSYHIATNYIPPFSFIIFALPNNHLLIW